MEVVVVVVVVEVVVVVVVELVVVVVVDGIAAEIATMSRLLETNRVFPSLLKTRSASKPVVVKPKPVAKVLTLPLGSTRKMVWVIGSVT